MKAKRNPFASCFGCMSGDKHDDKDTAAKGSVKVKKRGIPWAKKNRTTKNQTSDMDTSKTHFELPAHDTLPLSPGTERTDKGNESPSIHFGNTPSVDSMSEAEDTFEEEDKNKSTIQSPPPLVLDPVIISEEGKNEKARVKGRQSTSDVTDAISAKLRTEMPARRRMPTERENRLSCHPVMLRTESFMSSSSSGEDDVNEEECASDFE